MSTFIHEGKIYRVFGVKVLPPTEGYENFETFTIYTEVVEGTEEDDD